MSPATWKATQLFRHAGGTLRMPEALELGLSRWMLYSLVDRGILERISRGVYRLVELPPVGNPDLVIVSTRVPRGVICLISALAYHDLTTEVPHAVHLAIERGSEPPRIEHPPVRLYRFSGRAFSSGIQVHHVDGVPVRVYSPAKSVADCFKYRNKLGLDVALEALRGWRARKGAKVEELLAEARACRVDKVIRPYLEALL